MLTRRSFLGTVAALAVSPVASNAAPVAAERFRFVQTFAPLPFDNLAPRVELVNPRGQMVDASHGVAG